ncbi:MAG: DNA integrity scanning protein DisA nucleotide-binding domain protein [Syntrophaceae bacterium]|nr:DNA integrity scanning protein DisA nucleotide-binding domain protein [Syntrophaceae bacterium]
MDAIREWVSLLAEIGFSGLFDILLVTLMIYAFLAALKRTRRSGLIFTGILIVGAIYLIARKLNLLLTVSLLQGFFAVFLVALVIIFQEDLRYFFERVALWWFERRLPLYERKSARFLRREVEILARTLSDLAREKIGALVVIRGKDSIARHLDGGEEVRGLLSEPLLKSIFDPHSIGHDGAVVVGGNLIDKLGVHLPLSTNLEKLPGSGTRHAAALGLSERSDALCLVVSEERGTLSVARHGDIRMVSTPAEVAEVLEAFYDEISPPSEKSSWKRFVVKNYREKLISFFLAVVLWIVLGYGAQIVNRTFEVPVHYGPLPSSLTVARIDPPKVLVTLSGPRRAFALFKPGDIKLSLQLWDARKGQHDFFIPSGALSYPGGLQLEDINPRKVALDIEDKIPEPKSYP